MKIRTLSDSAFAQAIFPSGEGAQDAWLRAETEEAHRDAYRSGELDLHDAYELGIVDEIGRETKA